MPKNADAAPRQHGAMEYSDAPPWLDQVRLERLARLRTQLRDRDYAGLLLFNQINTRYATDATNMQIWCSHYETRCVFIATEGPVVLFDYANLPHLAEALPTIDEYRALPSAYFFTAGPNGPARAGEFADQIHDLMRRHGGGNLRLAVDHLSHRGVDALRHRGISIHDGEEVAERARAVKSPQEVELMRRAVHACEDAIAGMHRALKPGITENALWAELHAGNIRNGGEWIETRLLSSGPRTNPWFRECSMRRIEAGDLVCFDTDLIGPYGYCADISRAWLCGDGKPDREQDRLYNLAKEQIAYNTALLRPGAAFRDISDSAWKIPEEFLSNRYGSLIHGVGMADEYPSIKHATDYAAKGYDGVLEAGMTLCVESFIGAHGGKEGVKLEQQVLITPSGCELLSTYPLDL